MKKIYAFLFLILCAAIYFSCRKPITDTENAANQKQNTAVTSKSFNLVKNTVKTSSKLTKGSVALEKLGRSEAWADIPNDIKRKINETEPNLLTYSNTKVKAIIYNIEYQTQRYNYKSLVIYNYQGRFLPVIIESEKLENGFTQISFKDLKGSEYVGFLVNKENKIGKFAVKREIPFINIKGSANLKSSKSASVQSSENAYPDGPPCVKKTKTFSACMNCEISECSSDWVCTLGCGIEFVGCMAMFAAVCAFV